MSFTIPQTPQRPLPGAFVATPGARLQQPQFMPPSQQQQQQQQQSFPGQPSAPALPPPAAFNPLEQAARTINDTLQQEKRYPELESYVTQGISSDYEIPNNQAWAPFQRVKNYVIPERIMDQLNQGQLTTAMGLFAELNHAYVTIDNALYLWDYTHPNPEIIGFEDQPHQITTVKLVKPRKGVFVASISHLLVVATQTEIILIGMSCERGAEGVHSLSLYDTKMRVSIKGITVKEIVASSLSGRIFFGGTSSTDVYELTYQQEERWFSNRCGKINHTANGVGTALFALPFGPKENEHITQIVIDDSRSLLYTLSSRATIRVYYMKTPTTLDCVITSTLRAIKTNIGHMVQGSPLLENNVTIVSLSPITATEAQRLNLMATTNTGCRIYLSATSGAYYSSDNSAAPTSMQVHHVKFPLGDHSSSDRQYQTTSSQPYGAFIDTGSNSLTITAKCYRFAPGYCLFIVQKYGQSGNDMLFLSAPDSGQIARPQESLRIKFSETGLWFPLNTFYSDIGLITPQFGASSSPAGFGNELAVQFDQPVSEIAVMTSAGIQTMRRRRLVDIFAAAIRLGGGDDGLESEIKKFFRLYGRAETSATALAVACGQGADVTVDSRVARITDQETLEYARRAFIEYGGKPTLNENAMVDTAANPVDSVRPSPRHDGIALYISRLIRSVWKSNVVTEVSTPAGGVSVVPTVSVEKLQKVQRDLTHLREFLEANKSFIDGLGGPEALTRAANQQESFALQGEHRALTSLVQLIGSVVEGISFVIVLIDEQATDIVLSLSDTARQQVRELTFEGLFCTPAGKELAKELVKAIVNRSIAKGSSVDTVAEALRRRCGSFCSADDVVIFKAQETLKKASEAGANSDTSRRFLNDSLQLFMKVASSLSMEHLQWAVSQYIGQEFYAGAIRLSLQVAHQLDRENRALSWIKDGRPAQDSRITAFNKRSDCYGLIHQVVQAIDTASQRDINFQESQNNRAGKLRSEAYDEINSSEDEVFQYTLYDWYINEGWSDRLLQINSRFVVSYLEQKFDNGAQYADLLWQYYAHQQRYFEAAVVQLRLAKSNFELELATRIQYLGRARANASTRSGGISDSWIGPGQTKQLLLREVGDLLDIANIQEDLLQRMKADPRLSEDQRPAVVSRLNGQILPVDDLYSGLADDAGYYDLCLQIYLVADHRDMADIEATWTSLIEQTHNQAIELQQAPFEMVAEKVRELGRRLSLSETVFPVSVILTKLLNYIVGLGLQGPLDSRNPPFWIPEVFFDLKIPHESLIAVLENKFWSNEEPFSGRRGRRFIGNLIVYVINKWHDDTSRAGNVLFGGEENAVTVMELLRAIMSEQPHGYGADEIYMETARQLLESVEHFLR